MADQPCGINPGGALSRLFYSPREAWELLGISHATGYRLIRQQKLDARKLGTKTLISADSLQRLAADLPRLDGSK